MTVTIGEHKKINSNYNFIASREIFWSYLSNLIDTIKLTDRLFVLNNPIHRSLLMDLGFSEERRFRLTVQLMPDGVLEFETNLRVKFSFSYS